MFETLTMRAGLLVALAVVALLAGAGCDDKRGSPLPTPPLPTTAPAAVPQVSSDPSLPDARATLRAAGAAPAVADGAQRRPAQRAGAPRHDPGPGTHRHAVGEQLPQLALLSAGRAGCAWPHWHIETTRT